MTLIFLLIQYKVPIGLFECTQNLRIKTLDKLKSSLKIYCILVSEWAYLKYANFLTQFQVEWKQLVMRACKNGHIDKDFDTRKVGEIGVDI